MSKWKKVKIGDCCTIEKGSTGIKKSIVGDFAMVTTAEQRITHNEFQFDCEAVIIPLVSSTGHGHASIKRIHYQDGKFALGSILCAVISNKPNYLITKYLFIYLSYFKDDLLVPLMKGAANVSLSVSRIKDVEIYLPSPEKQQEIILRVQKVEEKNNILQNQISNQKDYIKSLRKKILQDAIEGKLTKEWREQNPNAEPASELLKKIKKEKEKLISEKKIKKEKPLPAIEESKIPFEIPKSWVWTMLGDFCLNMDEGRIPVSRSERLNKEKKFDYYGASGVIDKIDGFTHEGDFLLIGEDGANLQSRSTPIAFIVRGKFWVNNHAHVLKYFSEISLRYTENFINAIRLEPYITGGFQPKLNQSNLNRILIAIPPLAEQQAIVSKLENLMQKLDEAEKQIEKSLENSKLLTKAILAEAFKSE